MIAAGIGYVAGLLTAPKSGKETRKDIQHAAVKAKKEAEVTLKTIHKELDDTIIKAKDLSSKVSEAARDELNTLTGAAKETRQKVRELLSAF